MKFKQALKILVLVVFLPMVAFGQRDRSDMENYIDTNLPSASRITAATVRDVLKEIVGSYYSLLDDNVVTFQYSADGSAWDTVYNENTRYARAALSGGGYTAAILLTDATTYNVDGMRITNLAAGVDSTDAVNLQQLKDSLGNFTVAGGGGGLVKEVINGTANGVLKNFVLANTPDSNSEWIYLNGQLLAPTEDYTVSIDTVKFVTAPHTGDIIQVGYAVTEETEATVSGDYFINSATGNDLASGTSPDEAWASLSKLNSTTLTAGDTVLFARGTEYDGTITVGSSGTFGNPIVFGAYGTGAKPKIYGSKKITGWVVHSGNIYKATVGNDITQLFIDGTRVQNARLPKTGYFYIDTVHTTTSITCDSLDAGIDYAGANIHTRTVQWRLMSTDVSSSSSKTLTVSSAPGYGFEVNDAFFLNNHLDFLTEAGEWYYDDVNNVVYLWTPAGDSPVNYEVRGSTVENCVYAASRDYIVVKDLALLQSKGDALFSNAGNYLTVSGVDVYNPEGNGLYITNSRNLTVTGNYIRGAMEDGMYLSNGSISWAGESISVTDNEIRDIALFDEIGVQGIGTANGIFTRMNNPVVKHNKIYNNGYIAIQFYGQNTLVENNFIDGYCKTLIDGGGIYTWVGFEGDGVTPLSVHSSGSEVRENIILNGQSTYSGYNRTPTDGATAYGLYADEASTGVLFQDNVVGNAYSWGIFYNKTVDVISRSNLLYNTSGGFRLTRSSAVDSANVFKSNIVYQNVNTLDGGEYPKMIALSTDGATSTELDSNKYVNRVAAYANVLFRNLSTFSGMNFASWQTFTTQEANSSFTGTALSAGEEEELFYNETKTAKTFSVNGATTVYNAVTGDAVTTSFVLQPFTGVVLRGYDLDLISD